MGPLLIFMQWFSLLKMLGASQMYRKCMYSETVVIWTCRQVSVSEQVHRAMGPPGSTNINVCGVVPHIKGACYSMGIQRCRNSRISRHVDVQVEIVFRSRGETGLGYIKQLSILTSVEELPLLKLKPVVPTGTVYRGVGVVEVQVVKEGVGAGKPVF